MPRRKISRSKPKPTKGPPLFVPAAPKLDAAAKPKPDRSSPLDLTELAALPKLTARQHAFVEAIIAGNNQTDAYILALPSPTRPRRTSAIRGCEYAANPKVAAWIAHLRAAHASQGTYTLDQAVTEAEEARRMAARSGNAGAVTASVKLKADLAGLTVERHVTTHIDAAEVLKSLERLLGPDAARQSEPYARLMRRLEISHAPDVGST